MVGKKAVTVALVFFAAQIYCASYSENTYYEKYLESFPPNYDVESNSTADSNNTIVEIPRKYKKMRKKYLSDDENIQLEEKYYVGFTKNPFGPSSPVPRSKYVMLQNNDHSNHELKESRDKRGVAQLYSMVSCATGCDPISYKGYGCYCGFLGSGIITDSIDRCCMLHDLCYNTVNCPLFLEYFMPYLWKCWRGEPLCAIDHHGYGDANSCAARLCECDRKLAVCLSYSRCPSRRALCTSSPLRLLQNILMFK